MSDKSDQVENESPRKRLSPIAVVLVVLVLYPLSIGPMIKVADWMRWDIGTTLTFFGTLYFPIFWVAERVSWVDAMLEWYMKFFNGQS